LSALPLSKISNDACVFVPSVQDCTTVTADAGSEPVATAVDVIEPFLISWISLITEYLHPAG
jgi:hypothetical protein